MRTVRTLVTTLLLVAGLAAALPGSAGAAARPGELVVGLDAPLATLAPVLAVLNNPFLVTGYEDRSFYVLVRTAAADPQAVATTLSSLGGVRFVERNFIYQQAQSPAPNDALLGSQSYLGSVEALAGWSAGAGAGVTIAVADTGVDVGHPDLAPSLARNAGEVAGNGADDDGNGAIDDAVGFNFVTRSGDGVDDGGHGTEVAGAAAARGGDGAGIAGIAWQASLLPLKVLDGSGSGATTDVADAIRYAVGRGARVVNFSLIGPDRAQVVEEAIGAAEAANAVVVVAGGNQSTNVDQTPLYPAVDGHANVLSVAAHYENGDLAEFSNVGQALDVSAPGVSILSTARGGGHRAVDGTSIASPIAAGVAAVVAGARPGMSAAQVVDAIRGGAAARPLAGVATGRISLARSLGITAEQIAQAGAGAGGAGTGAPAASGTGSSSGLRIIIGKPSLAGARRGSRIRTARIRWTVRGATAAVRRFAVSVDGRRVRSLARRTRASNVRLRRGRHRITVSALGANGRVLARAARTFTVRR